MVISISDLSSRLVSLLPVMLSVRPWSSGYVSLSAALSVAVPSVSMVICVIVGIILRSVFVSSRESDCAASSSSLNSLERGKVVSSWQRCCSESNFFVYALLLVRQRRMRCIESMVVRISNATSRVSVFCILSALCRAWFMRLSISLFCRVMCRRSR